MNVPVLAGTSGTDKSGLGLNPSCDASGSCNVQDILINNTQPSTFFQPFIGYNNMQQKENSAVSSYNALQFNYRHAFSHGLTLQTTYTWSHAIDDSTSTYQQNGGGVDGNFNLSRWRATSDLNRTHIVQINYVYDIPLFKNSSPLLKGALGGCEISGHRQLLHWPAGRFQLHS